MRESRAYFLPSHIGFINTTSRESLVTQLSKDIAKILFFAKRRWNLLGSGVITL